MRLHAAIADAAGLYSKLLQDPLVPGFNSVMARLLLRYHLGRCDLPQVVFDEHADRNRVASDERRVYVRLIQLLNSRLDELKLQQ